MPHINYSLDYTVETFILHNNKVLLRRHDKYLNSKGVPLWLSVGGHIEPERGEDPNQAAKREVKEEIGMEIELFNPFTPSSVERLDEYNLIPPIFLNRHRINSTHEHCTFIYFAKSLTNNLILSEKEKSMECKWFDKSELESVSGELLKKDYFYAKTALEFYKPN